eukprot:evm.model.NODE_26981_length_61533_cov_35.017178.15
MPALDFKTLLQQERARKRHEQEQQQKEEVASEEEDDDDEEYKVPANFAARVDAMLGAVVASKVSPAVPLPEEGQDVDIMAVAAAKIVEESQQAKHCLHARLEPEYLGTAMAERNLARHALVGPPHVGYAKGPSSAVLWGQADRGRGELQAPGFASMGEAVMSDLDVGGRIRPGGDARPRTLERIPARARHHGTHRRSFFPLPRRHPEPGRPIHFSFQAAAGHGRD